VDYQHANLIIEVKADGICCSVPCYSNSLMLNLIASHGQPTVFHRKSQKPLPKVYIKTYSQSKNGAVQVYKDGYTDHWGAFDYASLSNPVLDEVERFSILVMSDNHGALVREVRPPKR